MVHCLLIAYNLDLNMECVQPKISTDDELSLFHSLYYLNYLRDECASRDDDSDGSEDVDDDQLNYGLGTQHVLVYKLYMILICAFIRLRLSQTQESPEIRMHNCGRYINLCRFVVVGKETCDKLVWWLASRSKVMQLFQIWIQFEFKPRIENNSTIFLQRWSRRVLLH